MDCCKSLWDITFIKKNINTIIGPNHCPITLSPQHSEILGKFWNADREQGCKSDTLKGPTGFSLLKNNR
jgi:hypothetical protein